jgi:hypothetical protein
VGRRPLRHFASRARRRRFELLQPLREVFAPASQVEDILLLTRERITQRRLRIVHERKTSFELFDALFEFGIAAHSMPPLFGAFSLPAPISTTHSIAIDRSTDPGAGGRRAADTAPGAV